MYIHISKLRKISGVPSDEISYMTIKRRITKKRNSPSYKRRFHTFDRIFEKGSFEKISHRKEKYIEKEDSRKSKPEKMCIKKYEKISRNKGYILKSSIRLIHEIKNMSRKPYNHEREKKKLYDPSSKCGVLLRSSSFSAKHFSQKTQHQSSF